MAYREYEPRYPLLARERDVRPAPVEYVPLAPVPLFVPRGAPVTETYVEDDVDDRARRRRTVWIIVIIVVIVVLIALAIGAYFLFFRSSSTTNNNTATGALNDPCSSSAPCTVLFSCDGGTCKSLHNGPCLQNSDCSQAITTQACTGANGTAGQCRYTNGEACAAYTDCVSGVCTAGSCIPCVTSVQCSNGQMCGAVTAGQCG
jgi:hypothetical protein